MFAHFPLRRHKQANSRTVNILCSHATTVGFLSALLSSYYAEHVSVMAEKRTESVRVSSALKHACLVFPVPQVLIIIIRGKLQRCTEDGRQAHYSDYYV